MHHPPMVKNDFQITELLKPPFTGGGNILTIVHSLEDSLGSVVVFDYGARKRKNYLLKNL